MSTRTRPPDGRRRFALLQGTLDIPPVDRLKRAFRAIRGLTPSDAHTLANDAYGILLRNLSKDAADTLAAALAAEGVATEVVPEDALPPLPPTRFVRRLTIGSDTLQLDDALGRPQPVDWRQIRVIAAGAVQMSDAERRETSPAPGDFQRALNSWLGRGPVPGDKYQAPTARATRSERFVIELILLGLASRVTIDATASASLLFPGLGADSLPELEGACLQLVATLAAGAPNALRTRGTEWACANPPDLFRYPSRNAFREELIWTLWRAQAAPDEAPPLPAD